MKREIFVEAEFRKQSLAELLSDDVAQLLFSARLLIGKNNLEAQNAVGTAIKKLQVISGELGHRVLSDFGLQIALIELLELRDIKDDTVNIRLPSPFDWSLEIAIYRIFQSLIEVLKPYGHVIQDYSVFLQNEEIMIDLYTSVKDEDIANLFTTIIAGQQRHIGLIEYCLGIRSESMIIDNSIQFHYTIPLSLESVRINT